MQEDDEIVCPTLADALLAALKMRKEEGMGRGIAVDGKIPEEALKEASARVPISYEKDGEMWKISLLH